MKIRCSSFPRASSSISRREVEPSGHSSATCWDPFVNATKPIVASRKLPSDFDVVSTFKRLANRPGCLWFDSASHAETRSHGADSPSVGDYRRLSRYSFLTSDPIDQLVVHLGDQNPWPAVERWCSELPSEVDRSLPPFQGGVAGLIGYEAGTWLEAVGVADQNDLPTPAIWIGKYDWTIAIDHHQGNAWIVCRDLDNTRDFHRRVEAANERLSEIDAWIESLASSDSLGPKDSDERTIESETDCGLNDLRELESGRENPVTGNDEPSVASNFPGDAFRGSVADVVDRIHRGDSFQVNVAQRLVCDAKADSASLYLALRETNSAPFAGFLNGGDFQVLSSSPEGFLRVKNGHVETRPIKGTVSRSGDAADDDRLAKSLIGSEKDQAENVMIVDLMRNDLSRSCSDDSVVVEKLCQHEMYRYVQHLVSVVTGQLRPDQNVATLLRNCFPGGSVTGAPKIEAMKTIAELEPHVRGAYCGSLGYMTTPVDADFNILIRTITATGGKWQMPVGGGITARSIPENEEKETWTKAEGMLRAIREF